MRHFYCLFIIIGSLHNVPEINNLFLDIYFYMIVFKTNCFCFPISSNKDTQELLPVLWPCLLYELDKLLYATWSLSNCLESVPLFQSTNSFN